MIVPALALLRSIGVSRSAALATFQKAWARAARIQPKHVSKIDTDARYAEIVALWCRDKRFVDDAGRPRALPRNGRNSFATLISAASPGTGVNDALTVLARFGTIRRTSRGEIRLIQQFFSVSSKKDLAFEPSADFLADASFTVLSSLRRGSAKKISRPFWIVADSVSVPKSAAGKFLAFAHRRSLAFSYEIDDWLQAHSVKVSSKTSRIRLGLGVFSISSTSGRVRNAAAK
jgi:hypothetical protein